MYDVEGKKFVIQWHLTHRCNLRCTHCYQEDYKTDLSKTDALNIFNQILSFFRENKCKGHINFTGGEPLLCDYLFDLLDLCENNKITFGLLTNGTLMNTDIIETLAKYKYLSFVQVSIDGLQKIHDTIRGNGSFDKALVALNLLNKQHIETMVAFTVHKNNYKDVDKVINLCRKKGVSRFWLDRVVPFDTLDMVLNNSEFETVVKTLIKQSKKKGMIIHMNRAMQFLYGSDTIYNCSAGKTLLAILADGTLLPCRRLPIRVGNVLETDLEILWGDNPILKELQDNEIPEECKNCLVSDRCKGGAKCLTYAIHKTYNKKDVNCYI